jgi:hypothetical protein
MACAYNVSSRDEQRTGFVTNWKIYPVLVTLHLTAIFAKVERKEKFCMEVYMWRKKKK